MQVCKFCKHAGTNMRMCKKCGKIWCQTCAVKGKGDYPRQKAVNICPYCGSLGSVTTAK